jgi:chromate transporter
MTPTPTPVTEQPTGGPVAEVFAAFLKLGLTSFGGPIAHLGYFREELVKRRRWVDEETFADLVALCQFLPGPASSQVGFSLGVIRGRGLIGGLAAWTAFTLPSALLLLALAFATTEFQGPAASGILHGLKLVAVAVVAQAVWGMAKALTPDGRRAAIALAAAAVVILVGGALGQIAAIAAGAAAGLVLCRSGGEALAAAPAFPVSRFQGAVALSLFALVLVVLPVLASATDWQAVRLFDAFYRAGALVFGGGHVVLPLLQGLVVAPGWISQDTFLAGYGLAQAVPGPLFTISAYLGAVASPEPNGIAGAAIALVAIFLPGLTLVYGAIPFWGAFRHRPRARSAMRGTNAAVVGILALALYDPVWVGAVHSPADFLLALTGFLLLTVWRLQPWMVVIGLALAGIVA